MLYAICSMKCWKRKHFFTSDFLRLVIVFYYAEKARLVSLPKTDMFALGLVAYILTKWVLLIEDGENYIVSYAYLCILGVFCVSLKLSTAMIVVLSVIPVYWLIIKRN